ncbi:MAG: DUF4357 domain-containing protein [Lachnospiraceae bacterium]|nr:DUF4357 domain-containing protein [Lachnospiraceae bacterium]
MIIKVYYVGRRYRTKAFGEYDTDTGHITVLKGSVISESITQFSGTKKVIKLRNQFTNEEGVLLRDMTFKSPTTAAKFVSGGSVNGLIAWHDGNKKTLKAILQEREK